VTTRRQKRTFEEIRKLILTDLRQGERTVNQIAESAGITWRTADNHLVYLVGRGIVEPVFVSKYVKIYRLKKEVAT